MSFVVFNAILLTSFGLGGSTAFLAVPLALVAGLFVPQSSSCWHWMVSEEFQKHVVLPLGLSVVALALSPLLHSLVHARLLSTIGTLLLIVIATLRSRNVAIQSAGVGAAVVLLVLDAAAVAFGSESFLALAFGLINAAAIMSMSHYGTSENLDKLIPALVVLTIVAPFNNVAGLAGALVLLILSATARRLHSEQFRPRASFVALGLLLALLFAGRGAFVTQPFAGLPASLKTAKLFDYNARQFIRDNEAQVRYALADAKELRTRYTFATSLDTKASSAVEHALRTVSPSLWRFVAIGLLGAFDGRLDGDEHAEKLWSLAFGRNVPDLAAANHVEVVEHVTRLLESTHSAVLETTLVLRTPTSWNTNTEARFKFRLPDGAAIESLSLGTNRATFVSPTVATEAYEAELRARVDPTIIELLTPNVAQLRVGPLSPNSTPVSFNMTLVGDANGDWALPTMLDMGKHTVIGPHRLCMRSMIDRGEAAPQDALAQKWKSLQDGELANSAGDCEFADADWLGGSLASLPRSAASRKAGQSNITVSIAGRVSGHVRITPLLDAAKAHDDLLRASSGKSFGIIVDRSSSMSKHAPVVLKLLDDARSAGLKAHVFLLAAHSRLEPPLIVAASGDGNLTRAAVLDTFGRQGIAQMIGQFDWLRAYGANVDVGILVTDADQSDADSDVERDFKRAPDDVPIVVLKAGSPLLNLHSSLRKRVRAVADTPQEALWRAAASALGADVRQHVEIAQIADAPTSHAQLKALAAEHLIARQPATDHLDLLQMAAQQSVVTFDSSLIAMENDRQRERLAYRAEAHAKLAEAVSRERRPALFERQSSSGARTALASTWTLVVAALVCILLA
jgi:hypothetical protein